MRDLLLITGAIAAHLFGERARLPAIVTLAPMPMVVWLAHSDLQDFPLLVLTVLAVWVLLRTQRFSSLKWSLVLGVVLALGSLCKFSYAEGVVGPFVVTFVAAVWRWIDDHRRDGDWRAARKPLGHLALALFIAATPFGFWYAPNWSATYPYLKQQYSTLPGSIHDPLAPAHLFSYLIITGNDMSFLAVGVAVVLGLVSLPWLLRRLRQHPGPSRESWLAAAFVATWFVIPIAVLAANVNQDPRYAIASYPALAVAVGAMVARCLRPTAGRVALGLLIAAALLQTLQVDAPSSLSFLPAQLSVTTADGSLTVPLHEADGPALTPTPVDTTMGVLLSIERHMRQRYGRIRPMMVLLLQDEAYVNGNNLSYDAYLRRDPFTFITLDYPVTRGYLLGGLSYAGMVLYVRQPPRSVGATQGAVGKINESSAARLMTPSMFAMFEPNPQRIDIAPYGGPGPDVAILVPRYQPR